VTDQGGRVGRTITNYWGRSGVDDSFTVSKDQVDRHRSHFGDLALRKNEVQLAVAIVDLEVLCCDRSGKLQQTLLNPNGPEQVVAAIVWFHVPVHADGRVCRHRE
jgi:hypothetical protein